MLIFEGGDNLGKTTAARRAVEIAQAKGLPAFYTHMTRPAKDFNFVTDYVDRMSVNAVQDRFHLGGIAYHDAVPIQYLKWIEGQLRVRASYIVLFISDNEEWYRDRLLKVNQRNEMYDIEKMLVFQEKFKSIAGNPQIEKDGVHHIYSERDFPKDSLIEFWVDEWMNRISALRFIQHHRSII